MQSRQSNCNSIVLLGSDIASTVYLFHRHLDRQRAPQIQLCSWLSALILKTLTTLKVGYMYV